MNHCTTCGQIIKQRSYFTGTWYSNTPNYHQALFFCYNLKQAKKAAQIYKKRENLKGKTTVSFSSKPK